MSDQSNTNEIQPNNQSSSRAKKVGLVGGVIVAGLLSARALTGGASEAPTEPVSSTTAVEDTTTTTEAPMSTSTIIIELPAPVAVESNTASTPSTTADPYAQRVPGVNYDGPTVAVEENNHKLPTTDTTIDPYAPRVPGVNYDGPTVAVEENNHKLPE